MQRAEDNKHQHELQLQKSLLAISYQGTMDQGTNGKLEGPATQLYIEEEKPQKLKEQSDLICKGKDLAFNMNLSIME